MGLQKKLSYDHKEIFDRPGRNTYGPAYKNTVLAMKIFRLS